MAVWELVRQKPAPHTKKLPAIEMIGAMAAILLLQRAGTKFQMRTKLESRKGKQRGEKSNSNCYLAIRNFH